MRASINMMVPKKIHTQFANVILLLDLPSGSLQLILIAR